MDGWNTIVSFRDDLFAGANLLLVSGRVCINPLTWRGNRQHDALHSIFSPCLPWWSTPQKKPKQLQNGVGRPFYACHVILKGPLLGMLMEVQGNFKTHADVTVMKSQQIDAMEIHR